MARMEIPEEVGARGRFPGFGSLETHPAPEKWERWRELDARAWPRRVEREYTLVPTVCFNCEAACGLLAYVDVQTLEIRKLEGHPLHPASRGRNCAKGPATVTQVSNPDRILYPLRRAGARGEGKWERVSWDEALDDIAGRIRAALLAGRRDSVVYHVGRPGEDLFTERVLLTWGVDGHNSHTNVCSAGARVGYAMWMGIDRPAPDHANARFILLMSSHLEAGHYFNPHAQRIMEAKQAGARIAVVDPRLSNTAAAADWWLSPWPGTEAGMLLAIAHVLIEEGYLNTDFVRRWVNWRQLMADREYLQYLADLGRLERLPPADDFGGFLWLLRELYRPYTPEWAAAECGVEAGALRAIAREIGRAGTAFASHIWRGAAAGHLGGWMVARNLFFLHVLTGSVGTKGGCLPSAYAKFVPKPPTHPHPIEAWNEAHWPKEYPLSHFEMSFLLPHLLERLDKKLDVYFTRVYNPVWTNPDGFSWIEMFLSDRIGLHVALTPTWNETAQYADYVLPMGLGPERHDLHSYETHAKQWVGFRQPVRRVAAERLGRPVGDTRLANPGEVWEENEFWIELSWRIDPDGSLGVRQHHESPYRPGEKIRIDEYYRWIFENGVPGLPEAAERAGLTPFEYMRRHGAFELPGAVYEEHERPVPPQVLAGAAVGPDGGVYTSSPPPKVNYRPYPGPFQDGEGRYRVGVMVEGEARTGFPTPSGLLEFYSTTLRDWGWPEYALPVYPLDEAGRQAMPHITSQVHHARIRWDESEFILLPTFRLPTLIHTRTNGAKWLYETAHHNPLWINPRDARRLGVRTGDLVRVETEIGYLVDRVWVTEAIRPGVVACSHHLGRWRLHEDHGSDRWNSSLVKLERAGTNWQMKQLHGAQPFPSSDPDSSRIGWREAGVHQNLIFPVQPDPISGAHCWHVRARVTKARPEDRYGDIAVDTARSRAVFRRWLELTRPAPGPGGLRRPYWLMRPLKPSPRAYRLVQEVACAPAGDG
ncbi:molybdopterin-dependent oxidoreductase [Caldinitratiruptor microaerophilus]|uniref:Formate dehydrogenase n=1 Tax=Caldinitratiruptor microaerophilus TaxID=671077 RepID=A0AA35GAN0_9FIRM|nr:molybdopterin-dependent oxidoreductase [Caldinitratiruptor microaerophilus]BDG61474.1 formate dehydrogenase [Caldinitratiruptor microaerophilus]